MKVLVSVCGIGLGHGTRSLPIVQRLREKGAEVKVLSFGKSYDYLKREGAPVEEVKGYDYKGKDYTFSLLFNIFKRFSSSDSFKGVYDSVKGKIEDFDPDVILSDSEPYSFFYGYFNDIENFFLTNLIDVSQGYDLIPEEYRGRRLSLQRFMINKLVKFIKRNTDKVFVPSFRGSVRYLDNVKYTDLIIRDKPSGVRKDLSEDLDIPFDDFYYVNLGGAGIEELLLEYIRRAVSDFEDENFVITGNQSVDGVKMGDNFKIFPFIDNPFPYIDKSKGFITSAGHSSISEALIYGKPVFAIPIINHIEQMVNSSIIRERNYGAAHFSKELNSRSIKKDLGKFFENLDTYEKQIARTSGFRGKGAKQISEAIL